MPHDARHGRNLLIWVILAVVAWGAYHVAGAYFYDRNPWRSLVVAGSFALFLGLWLLLLGLRRKRQSDGPKPPEPKIH